MAASMPPDVDRVPAADECLSSLCIAGVYVNLTLFGCAISYRLISNVFTGCATIFTNLQGR